jgi:2-methylisocitrate lyase-like PEP mutase family enzyme
VSALSQAARHPGAVGRLLLAQRRAIPLVGCHDALGAMLIEQAGFEAVYMSGYCVAASLGVPDIGLVSATQMVDRSSEIVGATSLPVIADADTGYGGVNNIAAAVRGFERAGVAAIHLEDQVSPKKCGAMAGKALVTDEEMSVRVRAALKSRSTSDFLVIARTDALSVAGMDEALRRARFLEALGADALMVPALATLDECRRMAEAVRIPILHTATETVRGAFPQRQLAETGIAMSMYTVSLIMASVGVQRRLLAELRSTGDTVGAVPQMIPLPELSKLLGSTRHAEFEAGITHGH